jgi:hypothetical protein
VVRLSGSVGSPVLMVLSCHPDTHYSCIRVRPVSILLGRDPHNSINNTTIIHMLQEIYIHHVGR